MPAAASAASEVRAAAARLRTAGEALRRRSRAEVLVVLGDVLEELRDSGSTLRRRLAAELPGATGLHPATLEAGLASGFAPWTRSALAALVASELAAGPPERRARGFPLTAVVLGGAIPMPNVLQLLAPLVLQSAVLARPGSHDPITAHALAHALSQRDPALGAALEIVSFPHRDGAALDALSEAECVVATGSDEAVGMIGRRMRPWQRFVGYGHRFSVAALGRAGDLAAHCERLAVDVALWDQQGCLSPLALYALGWHWEERAALLDHFENAFSEIEKRWPNGRIGPHEGAVRAHELATLEMRAASLGEVELRRPAGLPAWAIAAERDPAFRGSPLHRVLRVHFVPDAGGLCAALAPTAQHLAALGLGGLGDPAAREVCEAALALGASRICRLGEMQSPPLGWCHDGQGVLLPLARLSDSLEK